MKEAEIAKALFNEAKGHLFYAGWNTIVSISENKNYGDIPRKTIRRAERKAYSMYAKWEQERVSPLKIVK